MNEYVNRYWKEVDGRHELHFKEFDDDKVIATLTRDVGDAEVYNYTIGDRELFLTANCLSEAKAWVEDEIINIWNDEIRYMQERIERFNETGAAPDSYTFVCAKDRG